MVACYGMGYIGECCCPIGEHGCNELEGHAHACKLL
jgi:hypothetical protein